MDVKRETIELLLKKLEVANRDQGSRSKEAREIRRMLRRLGHWGGLRNRA